MQDTAEATQEKNMILIQVRSRTPIRNGFPVRGRRRSQAWRLWGSTKWSHLIEIWKTLDSRGCMRVHAGLEPCSERLCPSSQSWALCIVPAAYSTGFNVWKWLHQNGTLHRNVRRSPQWMRRCSFKASSCMMECFAYLNEFELSMWWHVLTGSPRGWTQHGETSHRVLQDQPPWGGPMGNGIGGSFWCANEGWLND